ncbi:hypothetical protein G6F22_021339 [Rhizopus arrhizus]|nr:hypothetical protein G6F22_021339 [Rhizopus arrhizus]
MKPRGMRWPETGKFCTARWVCAPQRASAGTCSSPMLSCSIRNPGVAPLLAALLIASTPHYFSWGKGSGGWQGVASRAGGCDNDTPLPAAWDDEGGPDRSACTAVLHAPG